MLAWLGPPAKWKWMQQEAYSRRTGMSKSLLFMAVLLLLTGLARAQEIANLNNAAAAVAATEAMPNKSTPAVSFGSQGLIFSTDDRGTRLQVHGFVQGDDRMFSDNIKGEALDMFTFRRIRPIFEGTLFNNIDFRFMPDF